MHVCEKKWAQNEGSTWRENTRVFKNAVVVVDLDCLASIPKILT